MHELLLIVVIAIVTLFTRTIPFLLFKNHKNALDVYKRQHQHWYKVLLLEVQMHYKMQ